MAILNIQSTNASLLDTEGGIGTGVDNGAWISTSYLIGEIVVIPLTDFLSRAFSFRGYLLSNAVLFPLFSIGCAFTHDLGSMSPDTADDQFWVPSIVRAIGQALVLTPISAITTTGIAASEAAAASGLSNMARFRPMPSRRAQLDAGFTTYRATRSAASAA